MANYNWPVTLSVPGPIQITVDGVISTINEDTINPESSITMPVHIFPLVPVASGYLAAASTPIPDNAYVEIINNTTEHAFEILVANSTGKTLILAEGAASSEVDLCYIPAASGLPRQTLLIKAGTRLSLKCQTTGGASVGEVVINLFGKGS